MQKRKLKLIQVFRGCAAILVLLFHITANFEVLFTGKEFLFGIFKFGAAGVDFFFVLSGFIIAYSSLELVQRQKYWNYIAHRLIRIYPIYWIVFIISLLPHIFFPQFYNTIYSLDWKNILSAFLLLPNHNMINGVSWTLSFELYFYLLFLIIFLFRNIKISFLLIIVYALITLLSSTLGINGFFVSPLICEFFLGIVAYFLFKYSFLKTNGLYLLIFGLLTFIVSAYLIDKNIILLNTELNRVIYFGLPSFFIILGAIIIETNKNINIKHLLLDIGDSSYSLYLIHLPIVVIALKVLSNKFSISLLLLNVYLLILCIFIIAISIVTHKLIEKPTTLFLKKNYKRLFKIDI